MKLQPLALAVSLSIAAGCAGTRVDPATVADAAPEATEESPGAKNLPEYLARLGITAEQRVELDAIRDRLVSRTRSADAQRLAFQDAIVGAIDACDSDYARLRIEGRRMIEAGEAAKPAVLDAINEFHALLTPEQRRMVVEPILERSERRRERSDEDGFATLGDKLDLRIAQMLKMVKRARNRITLTRSERDELRDRFDEAAKRFMGPQFDAHQEPLAQEPLVEHAVQFIFDLAAVVLPVLEEPQCQVAAEFARERLAEGDSRSDERTAKVGHAPK